MEVINYVGFSNNISKMNRFRDVKKIRSSRANALVNPVVQFGFSGETARLVRAAKPKKDSLNFKQILMYLGSAANWLIHNAKALIISVLAVLAIFIISFFSLKLVDYTQSHSGPLVLQEELQESEDPFELINKAMSSFALEDDYSSDGTLNNVEIDSEKMSKLFKLPVTFQTYKVQSGDNISGITKKFGLTNISTLIAINDIDNVRQLRAGQKLKIPSMDGIFYVVQKGNSINSICSKFNVSMEELLDVNDIESAELAVGQKLFIPGAKMDSKKLQEAMGEQFKKPLAIRYRLTSRFGPRIDPISGHKRSHTGVDMACPIGTPIMACGAGTVATSGFHQIYGNYVIIKHAGGYQTLYAHMSKVLVQKGQWVSQGTRIGLVGSTGYSTGPHLHLSVYKNGCLLDPLTIIK